MEIPTFAIGNPKRKWSNLDQIRSRIARLECKDYLEVQEQSELEQLRKLLPEEEKRAMREWNRSFRKSSSKRKR